MPISRSLALACTMGAALLAAPVHASTAEDTVDIDHLIKAYHQAVVDHDGQRLSGLFVPEGSAWFNVLSDEGLARVRVRKPDAAKVRPGSVADFVKLVTTSKVRLDPQHSDEQVRSDGTVATITFNFHFLADGKEQNRGAESWQLIRGVDGWRIVSIVYSSTPLAS